MSNTLKLNRMTIQDVLKLDTISAKDLVSFCIKNFEEDWSLIPKCYQEYKSYRLALRKTILLWYSIEDDIKKMRIVESLNNRASCQNSFALTISMKEITF